MPVTFPAIFCLVCSYCIYVLLFPWVFKAAVIDEESDWLLGLEMKSNFRIMWLTKTVNFRRYLLKLFQNLINTFKWGKTWPCTIMTNYHMWQQWYLYIVLTYTHTHTHTYAHLITSSSLHVKMIASSESVIWKVALYSIHVQMLSCNNLNYIIWCPACTSTIKRTEKGNTL